MSTIVFEPRVRTGRLTYSLASSDEGAYSRGYDAGSPTRLDSTRFHGSGPRPFVDVSSPCSNLAKLHRSFSALNLDDMDNFIAREDKIDDMGVTNKAEKEERRKER